MRRSPLQRTSLSSPTQFALQASASGDFAKKKTGAGLPGVSGGAAARTMHWILTTSYVKTVELLQTDPEVLAYVSGAFPLYHGGRVSGYEYGAV